MSDGKTFNPTIDRIIEAANRLRPLPANATRLTRILGEPRPSLNTLADLISLDQVLAAKVLHLANGEFRGDKGGCVSIAKATERVGVARIKTLVQAATAGGSLMNRLHGYNLEAEDLWRHALVTATAADIIASVTRYADGEEAYTAGLLHDIGKVVLDPYVRGRSGELVDLVQTHKLTLWQAEEQMFKMDHGTIGALMLDRWFLPEQISEAVRYHHWPTFASVNPKLTAIVHLANELAHTQSTAPQLSDNDRVLQEEALDALQLSATQVWKIRQSLFERFPS